MHFYIMSIVVDAPFNIISNLIWKHFYTMFIVVDAPFIIIKF